MCTYVKKKQYMHEKSETVLICPCEFARGQQQDTKLPLRHPALPPVNKASEWEWDTLISDFHARNTKHVLVFPCKNVSIVTNLLIPERILAYPLPLAWSQNMRTFIFEKLSLPPQQRLHYQLHLLPPAPDCISSEKANREQRLWQIHANPRAERNSHHHICWFSKMDFLTQIPVLECSRSNHLPSDTPPPHLQLPRDIGEKHVTFTDVIPSGPCLEVKTDCVSREAPTLILGNTWGFLQLK